MTLEVPALAAGFASKFDEIGPYIGFGSLVAVVAMAILVFAQGRELQRLREWAGSSPERLDALEQEVRFAGQRLAQPAPRPTPGAPGAIAAPGAAAVAGATAPGATAPGAPPRPPGAPGVPAPPGSPVVGAAAAAAPGAPGVPGPPGTARPTPPRPTPPGGPATRVLSSPSTAGGPRAATAAGAAAASARDRDRGGSGRPKHSIAQIIGVSVVGLIVVLALLFAFNVIGGGTDAPNEDPGPQGNGATPTTTTGPEPAPRYERTEMKTIVLNASGSGGLAKDVSDTVEEKFRFPMGEAANYTIGGVAQNAAVTTIQYRTGADQSVAQNRAAAQAVARFLKLRTTSTVVKRMTAEVAANAPGQKIAVIVGADYARANPPDPGAGTAGTSSTQGGATTTPGTTGGATGSTTTDSTTPPSTGQLAPDTSDLGTDSGAVDGTGGAAVP